MKTQKISRENLQEIYKSVCSGWQSVITKALEEQKFNSEINAPEDLITKAYNEADASQKKLLEKYFTFPKSIMTRVKTIEDVFDILGVTREEIVPWKTPKTKKQKSQNAFALIQCITEVYNEGVELDWTNSNQCKYYPYFDKAHGGWRVRSFSNYCVAFMGFGCYYTSSEKSLDAANKFLDIYNDYLP